MLNNNEAYHAEAALIVQLRAKSRIAAETSEQINRAQEKLNSLQTAYNNINQEIAGIRAGIAEMRKARST